MKVSNVKHVLQHAYEVGDAVLISSLHGIGKTRSVKDFAKNNGFFIKTLILSLLDEGDLTGVPYIENGSTHFAEPNWLTEMKKASEKGIPCILFLDELNRANKSVRQAALSLILDKQINEHKLPVLNGLDTLVCAAINPDTEDYQVDELDPALIDRFLLINLHVDADDWLIWGRENNLNELVLNFVANNPSKLHFTPENGIGPTPRSWEMLSRYIDNLSNINKSVLSDIIVGKIGEVVGVEFMAFLKKGLTLSIKDVENFVVTNTFTKSNLKSVTEKFSKLLFNVEPVTQIEIVKQMVKKYMVDKEASLYSDILPLLLMLYTMRIEVCTSVLKGLKTNQEGVFWKLSVLDDNFNEKGLFERISAARK